MGNFCDLEDLLVGFSKMKLGKHLSTEFYVTWEGKLHLRILFGKRELMNLSRLEFSQNTVEGLLKQVEQMVP